MDDETPIQENQEHLHEDGVIQSPIGSLRELMDLASGRMPDGQAAREDSGIIDAPPFPFLAIVGQEEMKLVLLLTLINPSIGGVLLLGPRGTGKTTAVRGLTDLLPKVPRSLCYYGCMPEDIETGGVDAVCQDCAKKFAMGDPIAVLDQVRLVELPLNSEIDDVLGSLDERATQQDRLRIRRGILSQADRNLLYVDEVNLLSDEIADAILDASAQGRYTVRRGSFSSTFRSRFALIGSMNPEEGQLRPQILDRFGLRVFLRGLDDQSERLEAYKRVRAYSNNPLEFLSQFSKGTTIAREEIQMARDRLSEVELPEKIAEMGLSLINKLGIQSLRAEITLFEAARAHAIADARVKVEAQDLKVIAPFALHLRHTKQIQEAKTGSAAEEDEINAAIQEVIPE